MSTTHHVETAYEAWQAAHNAFVKACQSGKFGANPAKNDRYWKAREELAGLAKKYWEQRDRLTQREIRGEDPK